MLRFEMEASIVMESEEEIAEALRKIADEIEDGTGRGFIPGEVQCAEWFIDEDFEEDYEEDSFEDEEQDEFEADEYGYN